MEKQRAEVKGKVYKRVLRPLILFGMEMVALPKDEGELGVAEFKIGVTRMDRIRNEPIRGTVQVAALRFIYSFIF